MHDDFTDGRALISRGQITKPEIIIVQTGHHLRVGLYMEDFEIQIKIVGTGLTTHTIHVVPYIDSTAWKIRKLNLIKIYFPYYFYENSHSYTLIDGYRLTRTCELCLCCTRIQAHITERDELLHILPG